MTPSVPIFSGTAPALSPCRSHHSDLDRAPGQPRSLPTPSRSVLQLRILSDLFSSTLAAFCNPPDLCNAFPTRPVRPPCDYQIRSTDLMRTTSIRWKPASRHADTADAPRCAFPSPPQRVQSLPRRSRWSGAFPGHWDMYQNLGIAAGPGFRCDLCAGSLHTRDRFLCRDFDVPPPPLCFKRTPTSEHASGHGDYCRNQLLRRSPCSIAPHTQPALMQ